MTVATRFAKAVWERESLLPTWWPDKRLTVGDVLRVADGQVTVVGQLDAMLAGHGAPAAVRVVSDEVDLQVALSDGVSVTASAAGAGPGSVRLRLDRARSFLFAASMVRTDRCAEFVQVEGLAADLYGAGLWRDEYRVVTEVRHASAATVVVAEEGGVEVDAEVRGFSGGGLPTAGAVRAGAEISRRSRTAQQFVLGACTPLCQAHKIRGGFFTPPRLVAQRGFDPGPAVVAGAATPAPAVLDPAGPADMGLG